MRRGDRQQRKWGPFGSHRWAGKFLPLSGSFYDSWRLYPWAQEPEEPEEEEQMWKLRLWWRWRLAAPNRPGGSSFSKAHQIFYFPTRRSPPHTHTHTHPLSRHDRLRDRPWTCARYAPGLFKEKEDSAKRCLAVKSVCLAWAVASFKSAQRGACRGGGTEGVVPAPPAQEIKAAVAAAALCASKALVRRRPVSQGGCILPTATTWVVPASLTLLVWYPRFIHVSNPPCNLGCFRRAPVAQTETRASTSWDVNNHEVGGESVSFTILQPSSQLRRTKNTLVSRGDHINWI